MLINSSSTCVARITPAIPSAIATLAVSGPSAIETVVSLVQLAGNASADLEVGRVRYGLWNPLAQSSAAEQVVVCRTGQQQVEIHCHGGNAVCELILGDLGQQGCIRCTAADFPSQFSDDFAREAEFDLQRATTERAAAILLDQLNGALGRTVARIKELVERGQRAMARELARETLSWHELGGHLSQPWQVVLAGPPNVGKSSLVNAIVGNQRVIVHHEPGTTRDWVEILTAIDGWPVAITDTAGLRKTSDEIEGEGMRRALARVQSCDLVILVIDAAQGWTDKHEELYRSTHDKRRLMVWNKCDLAKNRPPTAGAIATSAPHGEGIAELIAAIARALVPVDPDPLTPIPFRPQHVQLLEAFIASGPE